jgi:hypothetical protein
VKLAEAIMLPSLNYRCFSLRDAPLLHEGEISSPMRFTRVFTKILEKEAMQKT